MHNPRHISRKIPGLILPSNLSVSHQELIRYRYREIRGVLAVVLVSLEQEFGQSLGVVSHLFTVLKVITARNESLSFYSILICCWWISAGHQTMINRAQLMKLTGISRAQCSNILAQLFKCGYLARYRSHRHYYLTDAGSRYIQGFFKECFSVVLDLYDNSQ